MRASGDVITVLVDMEALRMSFAVNGVPMTRLSIPFDRLYPVIGLRKTYSDPNNKFSGPVLRVNFNSSLFVWPNAFTHIHQGPGHRYFCSGYREHRGAGQVLTVADARLMARLGSLLKDQGSQYPLTLKCIDILRNVEYLVMPVAEHVLSSRSCITPRQV